MRDDRLVNGFAITVRVLRWGNWLFLGLALLAIIGTFIFGVRLEAQLAHKYGAAVDPVAVIWFIRLLLLAGAVAVWPVERLFAALAAMLASVRAGDPFDSANAARLRTVGWSLLALQILDLGFGAASWWAMRHHVEGLDWQPSLTGWVSVLVAFVLARIFTAGATMRDNLAGTV